MTSPSARALPLLLLLVATAGCARPAGPLPIPSGAECARCGMPIEDLHYASEDRGGGQTRFYDSIECLLGATAPRDQAWIPDYDTRALHAADSMWVVKADVPSPMGGGFVAFLDRAAADEIAAARNGRVARWTDFAGAAGRAR